MIRLALIVALVLALTGLGARVLPLRCGYFHWGTMAAAWCRLGSG